MAVQGPIPVDFAHAFPRGAFAGGAFEPVRDFDLSKDGRFVQSKDKVTGLPLWQADVIDADPEARDDRGQGRGPGPGRARRRARGSGSMSGGYSYATLSLHPGEPVQVRVALHPDREAWIAVPGAGTGEPHLHISHGDVAVSIGPCTRGQVTAEDARIARELAGKAAKYAAEIERLHAASSADEAGDAAA